MKTIKIVAILITGLYFASCNKNDNPTPVAVTPNGTLLFHLHTNVDTNEVEEYNTVYTLDGGRKISVSKAQLYISNIQLVKTDGSIYNVDGKILLKVQETEVYTVGEVPVGNYATVKFDVGLDSATNKKTPAPTDTALYNASQWFGNTAQPLGYKYIDFEGAIDTTTAGNGTIEQMQYFMYEIGTPANKKTVKMPDQNFTITENNYAYVHITIDYNKLFTGIQLNNSANLMIMTVADNSTPLATQISDNIISMFSYEH